MASQNDARLVAEFYTVDLAKPLSGTAGPLTAYAATDRRAPTNALMAVAVPRRAPARARPLQVLQSPILDVLTPLAHGVGPGPNNGSAYYVISAAPPGPSLAVSLRPWGEAALINTVLRPVAQALDQLHAAEVTHRSIRLDNVFQERPGRAVVLGQAWASPPAMHQPTLYEPPYSAICHPAARGDGHIADDVYALGVLLLILALGRVPLSELDPDETIRRKLELGSYQALAGDVRLPPLIADLVRGMLAEDPDHRPPPSLLVDPGAARGRRVAARPPRRAQRPLQVGDYAVWDARTLAHVIATHPDHGVPAMLGGGIAQWLRRGLGDVTLGSRIEELVRHRQGDGATGQGADAFLVLRAVAMLDPLAPLCWRGIALWPDGLGAAVTDTIEGDPELSSRLQEVVMAEAIMSWGMLRTERCDSTRLQIESRQHRALASTRGPAGGMPRLAYALCPMLPCLSPLLARSWVSTPRAMMAALEAAAANADHSTSPVDAHIAAFLAARSERRLEVEAAGLNGSRGSHEVQLARLRLLAQLQLRYDQQAAPTLCAWVAKQCQPLIETWNNRPRRTLLTEQLATLAAAGYLPPMVGLMEDSGARAADEQGMQHATMTVQGIDQELALIASSGPHRTLSARRIGQEIAAGTGIVALALMLVLAALG
jgi:hypothetical protein